MPTLPTTPSVPNTDPCGNPLPIPVKLPDLTFSLPSPSDLLALLGVHIPKIELATPCPKLFDAAKAASGAPVP